MIKDISMGQTLSLEETKELINKGKVLLIAGVEELLNQLPMGNWIGGTIPYFMDQEGGKLSRETLFVNVLPDFCKPREIKFYDKKTISMIPKDYPSNGASFVIVPGLSQLHQEFANNVGSLKGIYNRPLIGWVSGVELDEIGKVTPKVYSGTQAQSSDEQIIVMHIDLHEDYYAEVDIINLFEQGNGDEILFTQDGFRIKEAFINGELQNFSKYLKEKQIDTQLPLVANYSGAMINTSFQLVDHELEEVQLYAPVFEGVVYKLATPLSNYELDFKAVLDKQEIRPVFSCNCILNYLYAGLEGKKTGEFVGPITFGEIAYVLLNQTMVFLEFKKKV